jgi:hypothetical protein
MRNAYKIVLERPERKRPLGRPRCRWKDYIRMNLREIGWKRIVWMHMAQDGDQ